MDDSLAETRRGGRESRCSSASRPCPNLPDDELEVEASIAAAARTTTRQRLFDVLLDELERRRAER